MCVKGVAMIITADSTSSSGHVAKVNGCELYFEDHGEGAPLVLLHGGLGSSAMLQPLLSHLVSSFRVITPDSRGHGRSTNPAGQLSYPLLADDIAALIAALELKQPIVGGWSDGGQVAMELGVRHPESVGGLIVGAAYPDFTTTGLRELNKQELAVGENGTPDIAGVEETLGDFASLVKSWHLCGEQQWHDLVHQTVPMWLDYPGIAPEDLRQLTTSTMILIGDRDESFPPELMVQLFRILPKAEFAVCPFADHLGPLLPHRAEVFAGVIRDFVSRCVSAD
jgi:pimeloyl-ACP methyl ester carboxylesterase